jgi:hypothetical protein
MTDTNLVSLALETYQRLFPGNTQNNSLATKTPNPSEVWNLSPLVQLPTVGQTLHAVEPTPYKSILIGACEDGMPFMLDLTQPSTGPILVTGDAECGKTRQLKVMVESALRSASPREIQIGVISDQLDEWSNLFDPYQRVKYSLGLYPWSGEAVIALIDAMVTLAEDRLGGRRGGPSILLMVDDLSRIDGLDYRAQMAFHWLLQNGAQAGIWVVASLQSDQAAEMPFWVALFRTRLFGKIGDSAIASQLAIYDGFELDHLISGLEFCTRTGKKWLSYWVPQLGD